VFPLSGAASVPTSSPAHFQGKMMTFGVAPSVDIYSKGRTRIAPVVELFGYRIVDGYSTWDSGPAAGTNILNLQAGARIVMGRNSIYGGWSKALTNATWYETAARVEFRHGI
jgi:predicted secreted acid phosphatase